MMSLALGACSPNAGGAGTGPGAMPGNDDDDEGTEDEGTEAVIDDTTSGADSTGTSATTMPPPGDDSADGPMMDEGPIGHPAVTISDGPVFDFGSHNLNDKGDQTFTVANEGDGDATVVGVGGVGGAFSIVTHDCAETLAPADTCMVVVRFLPTLFGDVQTDLQVSFQDGDMAQMVSRSLVGRGVGMTGNLLINGGGELGLATDIPPMGWTIGYGPNWSANWMEAMPQEGSRTISAGWGPPVINDFTLRQDVDIAALTTWGDASGVRVHYRAFHRSETDGNDPTWIELRFLDNGGSETHLYPGSLFSGITWNETAGDILVPAGVRFAQLSLQCNRVMNEWCSGFYDGMEVWVEWAG